jgi:toxin ParE1/3/4
MESYRVYLTRYAMRDLRQAFSYITYELREPPAAKKLAERIKTSVMGLAELPFRHALVSDENLASQGFRQTMVDNYMIFYLVSEDDNTVTVVRILYGKRNWINLLKGAPED